MQAMTLDSDNDSPLPPHTHESAAAAAAAAPDSTTAALCARLKQTELMPQDYADPIKSLVDQMREQRMSSVANPGQYVFTYLALMAGITAQLENEGVPTTSE